MDRIKTPAGDLDQNKFYDITLRKGPSTRVIKNARVRVFDQVERQYDSDGIAVSKTVEKRFELSGMHQNRRPETNIPEAQWQSYQEELTIGFLPEDIIEAKPSKIN